MADPIGFIGSLLGTISVATTSVQSARQYYRVIQSATTSPGLYGYGKPMEWVLALLYPDAVEVMDKVDQHVLRGDDQTVVAFLKSYTASFNMIGVAVCCSFDTD